MSILQMIEEKKAKMDLNKIKKYLRNFNTDIHQKNKETITTNTFQALKLTHNSHNDQEELTLYGDVVSKKELVYDGEFHSVLDIEKIKDIKNYIGNVNSFNYPEEIHESTVNETIDEIHKKMKAINTGDFNSPLNGDDSVLNNKVGNIRYEQKRRDIKETNSIELQTKIFINDELIYNHINEKKEKKRNDTILYINSKKIMTAKETIDNVLNQTIDNKAINKKTPRIKM